MLLALAASAGTEAHAQPMPMRPVPGVSPGRMPPPQPPPRAIGAVEAPAENLRGRFGIDVALRLLRSTDADERLRGLERAAATRTPEGLSLLERASGAGLPGGFDPRAPIDGVARQDPRALLVVVRGLASWVEREPARLALENLLRESAQAFTTRNPAESVGIRRRTRRRASARVLLARQEAAMALAGSGAPAALEALLAVPRAPERRRRGRRRRSTRWPMHPPVAPLLGGVALTTPGMVALAAELGDLRSLGAILGAVHASDPALRAAAVAALGLSGDARALEVAREAAKDKDARVRVAGAEALVHTWGPRTPDAGGRGAGGRRRHGARCAADRGGRPVRGGDEGRGGARGGGGGPRASRAGGRGAGSAGEPGGRDRAGDPRGRRAARAGDAMDALARSPCPAAMAAIEATATAPTTRRLAARAYFVRRAVRGERSPRGDTLLGALAASGDGAERALGVEALVALRRASAGSAPSGTGIRGCAARRRWGRSRWRTAGGKRTRRR
jgi:hypothetical protein